MTTAGTSRSDANVKISMSDSVGARLKINSAPREIVDAVASYILLAQPDHEMDFYELATEVLNSFKVEHVPRLAMTRYMLAFRRELEAARSSRDALLKKRLEAGRRLVPSLVDASFVQFVLRMLSYFENGLTEAEITKYWLDLHGLWFGSEQCGTVERLAAQMLNPVLQGLLSRQETWNIELLRRVDSTAAENRNNNSADNNASTKANSSASVSSSANSSAGSSASSSGENRDSAAVATEKTSQSSTASASDTKDTGEFSRLGDSECGEPPDLREHSADSARWMSITPFGKRRRAILVPALLLRDFPTADNHPVVGSLSYYLPAYNEFFLSTPNKFDASLRAFFAALEPARQQAQK